MGTIRSRVDSYYFARFPSDRQHVMSLLPWFDVTYAERIRSGPTAPTLYYLKPTTGDVARYLGTDANREIAYLHSPFPNFEARELKVLDEAVAREPLRLDPHLQLVATPDPRTDQTTRAILLQDLERTPIVGLSDAELYAIRSEDDLYRLFKTRHHIRDYFSLEGPLTEEAMFFGRSDLLSTITGRVVAGQNTGVFGLRRIGKTSILYAVGRRCLAARTAYAFYKDMSPTFNLRWWEVLQLLVSETAHSLTMSKQTQRRIHALTSGYDSSNAASHFGADIEFLCARVPHGRLVLMLDEIEHISFDISPAPHWSSDFLSMWTAMRSVHQNSHGKFSYIIAGVNPYVLDSDRVGQFDNPLFSTTKSIFVGPLDYQSSAHMVRSLGKMMGISLEKSLIDELFNAYGGHPFLTRQACSHLSKHLVERPAVLTRKMYVDDRRHLDELLRKVVDQILNVLKTWYPDEYDMLRILASGDRDGFLSLVDSDPTFSAHVSGYGLVSDTTGCPSISIGLVAEVLNATERRHESSADDPIVIDWDSVRAEVSLRRNRIEIALRQRLSFGLEMSFGKTKMNQALECIGQGRRVQLSSLSYRELWAKLYLNELIDILDTHWKIFEAWMSASKDDAISWLREVNKGRLDAHAGVMSSDQLAYLRICLRRVEERLDLAD